MQSSIKYSQKYFVLTFFLVVVSMIALGYIYFDKQKDDLRIGIQKDLSTIADMKVKDIVHWRKEMAAAATIIERNVSIVRDIEHFMADSSQSEIKNEITIWMKYLKEDYGYRGVVLLDKEGKARLSSDEQVKSVGKKTAEIAKEVLRAKKTFFSDFRWGEMEKVIRLDIYVPLINSKSNTAVGVLLLRIDPFRYLFPLIQSWPTQSATAETLLIRREGDSVLYLNELRHKKGTALNFRLPVSDEQAPAAMAVQGKEGIVEGIDYRGMPVLALVRAIPNSPWYMVAKMDMAEVYAPVREHLWIVVSSVAGMITIFGLVLGFIWRHQSARYILESRQKIQNILESITDCYFSLNREWRFTEINNQALQYFDMNRDDLLGKVFWDIFPVVRGSVIEENYKRAISDQEPLHFEVLSPQTNKWAEIHAYPSEEGLSVYFRNVTERKEMEEKLRKSENLYRAIGESINYGIWVCDADGRNVYASESFLEMAGMTQGECSNFGWGNVLHPDDAERTIAAWKECVRTRGKWDIVHRFRGVDGHWHHVLARGIPILDEQGEVICWAGINLDISKEKEMELQLLERTSQLQAVNEELESFSYSISHDLRAPLRAIDGYADMLLKKHSSEFDEDSLRKFNVIRSSTQRMGQLIEDILNLSRLGRRQMSFVKLDMEDIVRNVWREVQTHAPERKINLGVDGMPPGNGDKVLITQVYSNLLGNAVKFTKCRDIATVEVGGYTENNENVYYVKDNGAGFDMAYYDRLFGVFQRLHGVDEFEGTGIGLAIIQRVVRRHGGRVWAEGKVNEGATFYFSLPLSHSQE